MSSPSSSAGKIYSAFLYEVHSGDDLILMVDLGVEELFKKQRVRLHGVDTPNALGAAPDSPADRIRKDIRQMLRNKTLEIEVYSKVSSSWVAVVRVLVRNKTTGDQEKVNLNSLLISQGYTFKRTEEPTQ